MKKINVAHRMNASAMQLYWNIGKRLSEEGLEKDYGSQVVKQLSVDLKTEFLEYIGKMNLIVTQKI